MVLQVGELIHWCMQPYPGDRPTAREIFQVLHGLVMHPSAGTTPSQEAAVECTPPAPV